jgi:hypothetical protein
MRIGIIGSGGVAQNLAAGFAGKGYDVVIGTRDVKTSLANTATNPMGVPGLGLWSKSNPKVKVGTFAEAAMHGEVLVLAVHGENTAEAVKAAGPDNMAGKLVLDTGNPLDFSSGNGIHKAKSIPDSCLQVGQRAAPKAKFVKAFNCTPGHLMVNPKNKGDQLICGDDAKAKEQAAKILKEFGWNVADVGTADKAPYVEATAITFCNYALAKNDWNWVVAMPGRQG